MNIIITALTDIGQIAIEKLMEDSSYGVATRTVISLDPYTISITPTGLGRFANMIKNNPYAISAVESPMRDVLIDYGAKPSDFKITVVF
jgi:hypothetical protein